MTELRSEQRNLRVRSQVRTRVLLLVCVIAPASGGRVLRRVSDVSGKDVFSGKIRTYFDLHIRLTLSITTHYVYSHVSTHELKSQSRDIR